MLSTGLSQSGAGLRIGPLRLYARSGKINSIKKISERFLIEIIIRHKSRIIKDQKNKDQMQKDINNIIDNFIKKSGREVEQIEVEKQGDKYKLNLRVT